MYIYDYVLLFGWFWWPATLCTVNRIGEKVSFDLGKEIEKDVFRLVTSVGQRKTSESPWGIELQTFRAPSLSHRDSITKFICHASCILLGTRNVNSVTADNFSFIPISWQDEKHLSLSLCILTWKFQIEDLMKMHFFLSRHSYQRSVK